MSRQSPTVSDHLRRPFPFSTHFKRTTGRFRWVVVPVVLGGGIPLFAEGSGLHPLRLVAAKPFPDGLVELTYEARAEL